MLYLTLCGLVFICTWYISLTYTSIFYHRGLTHKALVMKPWLKRWVEHSGVWVTGLDPKAWICMHRLHHAMSDRPEDPHSPVNLGIMGTFLGQLHGYNKCILGLIGKRKYYTKHVEDLDFPLHRISTNRMWMAPYLVQLAIAIGIGCFYPLLAVAYFFGAISHPIQGWLVNAFGHSKGYRNFDLPDNSRNNTLVAWTVFGEGYQNNHHRFPTSPRFSVRLWEIDSGYWLCLLLRRLGLISFDTPAKVIMPA